MEKFPKKFTGLAAPLNRADVDTDQIIPKQFLKFVVKEGYGDYLFYHWRFDGGGRPRQEFELNFPRYVGASVLVAGENFGCGSSREHAAWAIADYGFKTVIAPSFADIFTGNAFNNGILLISLGPEIIAGWLERIQAAEGYRIAVDLKGQTLTGNDGFACNFSIDPAKKNALINGLDAIDLTLESDAAIGAYEESHKAAWQSAAPLAH